MSSESTTRPGSPLPNSIQVEGYQVLAELGRGAGSAVYRVRRADSTGQAQQPGRIPSQAQAQAQAQAAQYALKVLDVAAVDSSSMLVAFRREAALLASVNHPLLTRIHEVAVTAGRPYLVMDLVDGEQLAQRLTAGPLPAETVLTLALDVIDPLIAVHRRGLVHRDLKPSNIMVLPDGQARLIDFGLTARDDDGEDSVTVGTLAYSAPEQSGMLKRPVDNRSDLYSLGVVLFEALCGELPFATADVGELLRMHAVTPAPDLRALVAGLPPELAALVAKLLAKDPDDRYQSGETLAGDLYRLAQRLDLPLHGRRDPSVISRPRLSGRDGELATLSGRWSAVRDGAGGVCLIRAGGGMGKSRLTATLADAAAAEGTLVLRGKCSPDDAAPFAVLRTAIEEATRAPFTDLAGVDQADQQDQFAVGVAAHLVRLAQEFGPLILIIDDVQWLDQGSLKVLNRLAAELPTAPLLVLATGRDDPESTAATSGFVAAMGQALRLDLTLRPLDEAGVADQLAALMPGLSRDSVLVRLLITRSNGNPFVVQEYLRAVVDAGLLQPSWGSWILDERGLDALELPQDAMGLVITRVQALGPGVREVLVSAAVIGNRFSAATLAGATGRAPEQVLEVLAEAVRHGLLEPRDGGRFAFLHDRIREALLEDVDTGVRARLHAQIAVALELGAGPLASADPEAVYAVAHHYMRSEPDPAERPAEADRAFAACWAAGRLAEEQHAPADVVRFLQFAVELAGEPPSRLLILLGAAQKQVGLLEPARDNLQRALQTERDPMIRAEAYRNLAEVHKSNWNGLLAMQTVDLGLRELGAPMTRHPLVRVLSSLLLFVSAVFRRKFGIGTVPGDDAERERRAMIVALHDVGSYASLLSSDLPGMLAYNLRMIYWVTRAGPGRVNASAQTSFGVMAGALGLARLSQRSIARAKADPSAGLPAIQAWIAHGEGAASFLGGVAPDVRSWAEQLDELGKWLDVGPFLDGASLFNLSACNEGRTRQAQYWLAKGMQRWNPDEPSPFMTASATTAALLGRTAEASTQLRRVDELLTRHSTPGLLIGRLHALIFVLLEQADLGERFEHAVVEFRALKVPKIAVMRAHQVIYFHIAQARLAQLRSAGADQRAARVAAARTAVREVPGKGGPEIRTRSVLVRADLLVLEGRPGKALAVLAELDGFEPPEAPKLDFEAARVRARALSALGRPWQAQRQARLAYAIAQEEGWPHWQRAVTAEFQVAPASALTVTSTTAFRTSTRSGGLDSHRLRALQEVSAAASRVLDPGALARIALDEMIRILAADRAFLFLADGAGDGSAGAGGGALDPARDRDDGGELRQYLGRDAAGQDVLEFTGYSASLVERVRLSGLPEIMTGTEEGAALGAESVVLHGLRSILVAPMQLEGRLLGVVYLDSQVAQGIFSADDVGILTALTNQIASSLETARAAQLEISVQTVQRQRDLAEQLRLSLEEMSGSLDPVEVTKRMIRATCRVLDCEAAWVIGNADGPLVIGLDQLTGELERQPAADEPRFRALINQDEPSVGTPGAVPEVLAAALADATSWIAVPLRTHHGKLGCLIAASRAPDADLQIQLEVAAAVAMQGITAYDKATLFTQVQELAVVDELTGLANRRRFFEVATRDLADAARHRLRPSAMMIDIDLFKRVNDEYGHPTGDDVIHTVARRLADQVRQTDILGRYGGEEFALMIKDGVGDSDLPERLRRSIADTPVQTRTGPLNITISIGLTHQDAATTTVPDLLASADQALYQAKQQGRNRVCAAES